MDGCADWFSIPFLLLATTIDVREQYHHARLITYHATRRAAAVQRTIQLPERGSTYVLFFTTSNECKEKKLRSYFNSK